jgi:hypothetical protein
MLRVVRSEVEISDNVGGFSVDFCGHCRSLPDGQNISNHTVCELD